MWLVHDVSEKQARDELNVLSRASLDLVGAALQSSELPLLKRRDLFLLDKNHEVAYNNFNLTDIEDGSMVECRNQAYVLVAEQSSAWQHAGDMQAGGDEDRQQQTSLNLPARIRDMLGGGESFSMCDTAASLLTCQCREPPRLTRSSFADQH